MSQTRKTTIAAVIFLVIGLAGGLLLGQVVSPSRTIITTATETRISTVSVTSLQTVVQTVTTTSVLTQVRELQKPEVEYAKLFDIDRGGDYTLLRDAVNRTILLVPREKPVPTIKADLVIRIPVERAVLMSSTHVAFVERLREYSPEILDRVAAIMWGQSYEWFFPEVQRRLADGRIKDVGAAWSPDYEAIVAIKPDLVMIYTFPGDPVVSKLEELKLPYVVNNEYLETHPLGRFEWVKFVAAFFGLDSIGEKVFEKTEAAYLLTATKARSLIDYGIEESRKVVWFSVFRGTVYVAGGRSFVGTALSDLGAAYVFANIGSTGSATVSVEELVSKAIDADVIVLSTEFITSVEDLLKEVPQLAQAKAIRENRVYRYNSNIFQLSFYETERWFLEIAEILYPGRFVDELTMFSAVR